MHLIDFPIIGEIIIISLYISMVDRYDLAFRWELSKSTLATIRWTPSDLGQLLPFHGAVRVFCLLALPVSWNRYAWVIFFIGLLVFVERIGTSDSRCDEPGRHTRRD